MILSQMGTGTAAVASLISFGDFRSREIMMSHTITADFVAPTDWFAAATLGGVGSVMADAMVIPASKHPSGLREFADFVARQTVVREIVDAINYLLSHASILLSAAWDWVSGLLTWASDAISELVAWLVNLL